MASFQSMLLAVLVCSGAVIGLSNFAVEVGTRNGVSIANISGNLSYAERITNETKTMQANLQGAQITNTPADLLLIIPMGVYSVIHLIFSVIFNLYSGFIVGIAYYLHLPDWFANGIVYGSLIIIFCFAFINAILKWDT